MSARLPLSAVARRAGGALAAACLTTPLLLSPAQAAETVIRPGTLDRGSDTGLLHSEGSTIVDGALRVSVDAGQVYLLGRAGEDYVAMTRDQDGQDPRIVRVAPDGTSTTLVARETEQAIVSGDGKRVAYTYPTATSGDVVVVKNTATGTVIGRLSSKRWQSLAANGAKRVLLSQAGSAGSKTYWWNPVTGSRTLVARQSAGVASIAADRLALYTGDPYDGGCQRVVRLSKPSEQLWRSCTQGVRRFSPDGQRMFTTYILSDGPGPSMVQLRGARGGLIATYRAVLFGATVFEGQHRPLLQAAGEEVASMVRRTSDGSLERASKSYQVGPETDALTPMDWSFPSQ